MAPIRALVIEDDSNNSDILSELLNTESVTCSTIRDPRTVAGYIAEQRPPDVIFLDLEMPFIDGYEILAILKADPKWSSTPVIACTIHISELREAMTRPFQGFLGKPLDAERFPTQLEKILRNERVWDSGLFGS